MADRKRKQPDTDAHFYMTRQWTTRGCERRRCERHYRCKICEAVIRGKNEMRDHVVTHDATLQADLLQHRNAASAKPPLSCGRSGQNYPDCPSGRSWMARHIETCGTETICSKCRIDFKKPHWLRSHMAQIPDCTKRTESWECYCMSCEGRPA